MISQFLHLSSLVNMVHEPQFPHLVNGIKKHALHSVGKFPVKCGLLCLALSDAQCRGANTPHSSLSLSLSLSLAFVLALPSACTFVLWLPLGMVGMTADPAC